MKRKKIENTVLCYDRYRTQTKNAYLLKFNNDSFKNVWVPKSQCAISRRHHEITMPNWLCDANNLHQFKKPDRKK